MKKSLCILASMILSLSWSCLAKTELTVYTAIEPDLLPKYKKSFEKQHPDIKIKWVRDSTGTITAKILAEKENPQADVILGVAASSFAILKANDLLLPYKPVGLEKINKLTNDKDEIPTWVGMNIWASAFCVNHKELKKQNLPMPKTWKDLLNPIYKDKIVMPAPDSSGTGYMNLTAWIQMWGEKAAWQYVDQLKGNVKSLTHSGVQPCIMAAQGEIPIGVSAGSFIPKLIKRGAPITMILPEEGLGWEAEASAIVKGTKNLEAAKAMQNWVTSDDVGDLGVFYSGLPARTDMTPETSKETESKLIKNDLEWAAKNRERLLKTWKEKVN